jgi:hypothetical protein
LTDKLGAAGSKCNLLKWHLSPVSPEPTIPTNLNNFSLRHQCSQPAVSMQQIISSASLSPSDIAHVETLTRGQSTNPAWHEMRLYRLTASNFGQVIKSMERGSYPPSLMQKLAGN